LSFAKILLAEFGNNIDIFEPVGVPEGVEILACGMKRMAKPLRGRVVEIGIDATLNRRVVHAYSEYSWVRLKT